MDAREFGGDGKRKLEERMLELYPSRVFHLDCSSSGVISFEFALSTFRDIGLLLKGCCK